MTLLLAAACSPGSTRSTSVDADPASSPDPDLVAWAASVAPGAGEVGITDDGLVLALGEEAVALRAAWIEAGSTRTLLADGVPALVGASSVGVPSLGGAAVVAWDRGAAREWWAEAPGGLEHGFVLDAAPAGGTTVTFGLEVHGASARQAGEGAVLVTRVGALLSYTGLRAWDARGRELAAVLDVVGPRIELTVDVAGAAYPVVVDPVLSTGTTPVSSGTQGDFSGAGDLDADGYADFVALDDATGVLSWYRGSASGLATSASGTITSYPFGPYTVLDAAGDVNGDGYDDLVVANPSTSLQRGRVYVFRGSASGLSSTASVTVTGSTAYGRLGTEVAGIGDTNGDGYDDFAVANGSGAVHVYQGRPGSLPRPRRVTVANWGTTGETLAGGDLNGDGYSELVVGRYQYDNGVSGGYSPGYTGAVDVYAGSATGTSSTADTIVWPFGYWYDSYASACWDMQRFGWSVAVVPDADADGYADLAVGLSTDCEYGATVLYYGSAAGVDDSAWAYFFGRTEYAPYHDGAFSGYSLAVGDFDGSGAGDYASGGGPVTVMESSGSRFALSDTTVFNVLYGTELSGTWSYSADGYTFTTATVDTVGDVNGDGCDDLAVWNPTSLTAGDLSIHYGSDCSTGVDEAESLPDAVE